MENPIRRQLGDDGTAQLAVHGEIDFSNSDEVAQALRDAVTDWSPPELWVDLTEASFIDSTGLGALIEGYRAATAANCRFVVTNASPSFRRVLTVTGLCELFGMTDQGDATAFTTATGA
jgi:anti-sigma B factor antagonist